jgi:hypothetical protein
LRARCVGAVVRGRAVVDAQRDGAIGDGCRRDERGASARSRQRAPDGTVSLISTPAAGSVPVMLRRMPATSSDDVRSEPGQAMRCKLETGPWSSVAVTPPAPFCPRTMSTVTIVCASPVTALRLTHVTLSSQPLPILTIAVAGVTRLAGAASS